MKYIKKNVLKLIDVAVSHPALLNLMLDNRFLTQEDAETYILAAKKKNLNGLIKTLMDYVDSLSLETGKKITEKKDDKLKGEDTISHDFFIKECVLEKYIGTDSVVMIPKGIKKIGDEAFAGNECITTVEIPDNVIEIGAKAFARCPYLTKVTIPETAKEVHFSPFSDCPGIKSIGPIGSGCSCEYGWKGSIPGYAFSWMPELESVIVSEDIHIIGKSAFSHCVSLKRVEIPESCEMIAGNAFQFCESLASVIIPDSVNEIGNYAFEGCSALTSITMPNNVEYIGDGAFMYCKRLSSITIPKGISHISERLFANCEQLTSIEIPEGVKYIGLGAFYACSKLSEVNLPVSLEVIGCMIDAWSYEGKDEVHFNYYTPIDMPDYKGRRWKEMVTKGAFEKCKKLTSISIPENISYIATGSFAECSSLVSITIPKEIRLTEKGIFSKCTAIKIITSGTRLNKKIFEPEIPMGPFLVDDPGILPNEMKIGAAIGFAEENADVTTERGKKHLKYIKSNAAKIISEAFTHPALLNLMIDNKLLTPEVTDAYIEAAQQKNDPVIIAVLLDYKENKLTQTEKKKATKKAEAKEEKIVEFIFDTEAAEKLQGKKIVVTGKLTTFNSREELKACMDACGVTLTETLNAETDYLITNTPNSGSAKNKKAVELGITRITEAEFNEMISRKPKE